MKTTVCASFTGDGLRGNPAGVVLLDQWAEAADMQAVAAANGFPETAFVVLDGPGEGLIRWFTPTVEVPLCGHATAATAFVLSQAGHGARFDLATRFGDRLTAWIEGAGLVCLDFPAKSLTPAPDADLTAALGSPPAEILAGDSWVALYDDEDQVRGLAPTMAAIAAAGRDGIIVTAPGRRGHDVVSRYFVPQSGIPEDPVTGYAHTLLAPLWTARLGRNPLRCLQASARGGELLCEVRGERVILKGRVEVEPPAAREIPAGGAPQA